MKSCRFFVGTRVVRVAAELANFHHVSTAVGISLAHPMASELHYTLAEGILIVARSLLST